MMEDPLHVEPFVYIDCSPAVKQELFYEEEQSVDVSDRDPAVEKDKDPGTKRGSLSEKGLLKGTKDSRFIVESEPLEQSRPVVGGQHQKGRCADCKKVFTSLKNENLCKNCTLSSFRTFNRSQPKSSPVCKFCGKTFSFPSKLAIHIVRAHSKPKGENYRSSVANGYGPQSNLDRDILSKSSTETVFEKRKETKIQSRKRKPEQSSHTAYHPLTNAAVDQTISNSNWHQPAVGQGVCVNSNQINNSYTKSLPVPSEQARISFSANPSQSSQDRNYISLKSLLGYDKFTPITKVDTAKNDKSSKRVEQEHCDPELMAFSNGGFPYKDGSNTNRSSRENFQTDTATTHNDTGYSNVNRYPEMSTNSSVISSQDIFNNHKAKQRRINKSLKKPIQRKAELCMTAKNQRFEPSIETNPETSHTRNPLPIPCKVFQNIAILNQKFTNIRQKNKSNEERSHRWSEQCKNSTDNLQMANNKTIKNLMDEKPNQKMNRSMADKYTTRDIAVHYRNEQRNNPNINVVLNVFTSNSSEPSKTVHDSALCDNPSKNVVPCRENYASIKRSRGIPNNSKVANKHSGGGKFDREYLTKSIGVLKTGVSSQKNISIKGISQINQDFREAQSHVRVPFESSSSNSQVVVLDDSSDEDTNVIETLHQTSEISHLRHTNATVENAINECRNYNTIPNVSENSQPLYNYTVCKGCQRLETRAKMTGFYCHDCVNKGNIKSVSACYLTSKKTNICGSCGQQFPSAALLKSHMTTHENNADFECSVCGITFGEMNDLVRHELVCYRQFQK